MLLHREEKRKKIKKGLLPRCIDPVDPRKDIITST